MLSSTISLSEQLDSWVVAGSVTVVETVQAITVGRLSATQAEILFEGFEAVDWPMQLTDAAHEIIDREELTEVPGPFIAVIQKPFEGVNRVLTLEGLSQLLSKPAFAGEWQVVPCQTSFATGLAAIHPWGHGDLFSPAPEKKSPRDIVRERAVDRRVPIDVRAWLVRGEVGLQAWADPAFRTFARLAAPALVRVIASETDGPGVVTFSGPPRITICFDEATLVDALDHSAFSSLQACANWVYENSTTTEQKHALLSAEIARSIPRGVDFAAAFRMISVDALDGAKLAFQLSQSDVSRDALKAQADLRKSIADDTAKIAEATRTLTGALALAVATGLGLVTAKATATGDPKILSGVSIIASLYVLAVALSGWFYLGNQDRLRAQWRKHFYRFIPDEDYRQMVTDPVRDAGWPYHFVGVIALIVALGLAGFAFN
jgi:hypothetical protein